jgi:glycosyltransferase involved in cell wall biosynthesis
MHAMNRPKILITTYHEAFLTRGGGEFEISKMATSLKMNGFIADIYGPFSRDIEDYDVVYHFSVHAGGLDLLRKVRDHGLRIILSPNVYLDENFTEDIPIIQSHVDLADVIVFKSSAEKENFTKHFEVRDDRVEIVPQAIDESILQRAPEGLFKELYNVDKFCVTFGLIDRNKNQLNVIKAVREFGIPLVVIGKYRDKNYYDSCLGEAPDNFIFIDSLYYHSDVMRSALQEASFFIETSKEPAGISAIEAGLSGCKMVLSDSNWSREHFGLHPSYVNSDSISSIVSGVKSVLESDATGMQRSLLHHLSGENVKLLDNVLLNRFAD